MIKKIVVIGPESTGKSTLCEALARHYQSDWCPEFARAYLLEHGTDYSLEDLAAIAKGQLQLEADHLDAAQRRGSEVLFLDTDMYVMKVWCEFVFGQCHRFILDEIVSRKYDLYLLCNTDLPWTRDALREYPDLKTREALFKMYQDLLINQSTPWVEIKGTDAQRLQTAIDATDALLQGR